MRQSGDASMGLAMARAIAGLAWMLVGCDDPIAPPRGPSDVLGWVHDPQGVPVESARMRIGTHTAYSAEDGFFRIPNVALPYDLVVEEPGTFVFHGLENVDPQIEIPYSGFSGTRRAYVTGRVPWHQGERTRVFLFGSGMQALYTQAQEFSGAYLILPTWVSRDVTRSISLFMLRNRSRLEWGFDDYATRSLRIADGQRLIVDAQERDFKPVMPFAVDVEVVPPPSMTYVSVALVIQTPGSSDFYIAGGMLRDGHGVTLQAPGVPSLPLQVVVWGRTPEFELAEARVDVSPNGSSVLVNIRPPTLLVAPTDSAQVSAQPELEWSDSEVGGVYAVHLFIEGRGGMTLFTDENRISLANIPFQNGLPPGTRCQWYVESLGAARTVNDLVVQPGAFAVRDRAWTSSARRVFQVDSLGKHATDR